MMKCTSCGEGLYTEAEAEEYLALKKRIRNLEEVLNVIAVQRTSDEDAAFMVKLARTVLAQGVEE